MKLLALDPGTTETGFVLMDGYKPVDFGKVSNDYMMDKIREVAIGNDNLIVVIEKIESYGIKVSESIFTTIFWCGRYWQLSVSLGLKPYWITRRAVKSNLCKGKVFKTKSWDSKIRQALIDRFGVVGTKGNQGFFYGFKADCWAAFAVGVTHLDKSTVKYKLKRRVHN